MKKPLKVEFDNKTVQIKNDISLSIDSNVVFKNIYTTQKRLTADLNAIKLLLPK